MMNAVGGTSLHYWAQSWRLNPWDFGVVSETKRRYGASRIPKGSTVEDWPFGLDELERTTTRSSKSACRDRRQRQRQDRCARQPFEAAQRGYLMPRCAATSS
jgi:hypothetical protein